MSSPTSTRSAGSECLAGDLGQATAEYALVTLLTMIILIALLNMYGAVRDSGLVEETAKAAPYAVTDPIGAVRDVLRH